MSIVLIGKYTSLQDSYMSVVKALEHASMRCGQKLDLQVRGDVKPLSLPSPQPQCPTTFRTASSPSHYVLVKPSRLLLSSRKDENLTT